jgi:hypothetical protein
VPELADGPDLGLGAWPEDGCRRMTNNAVDVGLCVHPPDVRCRRMTPGDERCVRSVCERASWALLHRTEIGPLPPNRGIHCGSRRIERGRRAARHCHSGRHEPTASSPTGDVKRRNLSHGHRTLAAGADDRSLPGIVPPLSCPPVFKTGVPARAGRRVRFPSASATRFWLSRVR